MQACGSSGGTRSQSASSTHSTRYPGPGGREASLGMVGSCPQALDKDGSGAGGDTGLPEVPLLTHPAPLTTAALSWSPPVLSPALSTLSSLSLESQDTLSHQPFSHSIFSPSVLTPPSAHLSAVHSQLKTPLGKGRAFIRFCLAHGQLAESLQLCLLNPELTRWVRASLPQKG